jgi:hypothetical protein
MNDSKLKLLVTEAVKLDREIAVKQDQLKALKATLTAEAESRQEDAQPTEGGGTSTTLEGIDGAVCRVTQTGRALKSSINAEGPLWDKIRKALDGRVPVTVFTPEVSYKPGENFRERVVDILGKAEGNKLIKLCENAGKTTVSFETKESVS